ncbi:HNH endonuclease [Acinetobacter sp. ANC 5033]|uniref:HNH endonuclease n=1 Tax=Acinetobacter amyesii TaxID=2942470 RepID=UPI00201B8799|nr:HNH endonuclease [Acinetobacter amyesii]MCL6236988.1 HNH endonuclease [Acinetobacter amyesii]
MLIYQYTESEEEIIRTYNLTDHAFWNEKASELAPLRLNLRLHYLTQQGYRCCYCKQLKQEEHGSTWDVEHIAPKALHPKFLFEPYNLCISCKECNESKSNKPVFNNGYDYKKYPLKSENFTIIHPHFDVYSEHMAIRRSPDGKIMHIPKTEKGKRVFEHCDLVRFTMSFYNSDDLDQNLLINFSSLIDVIPNLTHDTAKAIFIASLPRELAPEYLNF